MNAHHKKTHKISLSSQSSTKAHTTTTRKIGTIECSGVQVEGNDEDEGYGGNVTKGPFQTRRALFSSLNARPFGAKLEIVLDLTSIASSSSSSDQETTAIPPISDAPISASDSNPGDRLDKFERILERAGTYTIIHGMDLGTILDDWFMENFVLNTSGSLIALNIGTPEDDIVSLDGRGRMVLNVTKDTYQQLGLVGRPSIFGSLNGRYIIEISLLSPSFAQGGARSNAYNQLRKALSNWPIRRSMFASEIGGIPVPNQQEGEGKKFDMMFSYLAAKGTKEEVQTGISIPLHLKASMNYSHHSCHITPRLLLPSSLTSRNHIAALFAYSPVALKYHLSANDSYSSSRSLDVSSKIEFEEREEKYEEAMEWLDGLLIDGGSDLVVSRDEGTELGDKEVGVERVDEGQLVCCEVSGFFHPKFLASLLITSLSDDFISLTLTPPSNSPLSHLSSKSPTISTRCRQPKRSKQKRGLGRGEEEEFDLEAGRGVGEGEGGKFRCVVSGRVELWSYRAPGHSVDERLWQTEEGI